MDFDLTEEQRLLKDSVEGLLTDRYDFEQRKKHGSRRRRAGATRSGRSSPSWACSACRSRKPMAASARARSRP